MKYILRNIEKALMAAVEHFGAVLVTGPRRAGKTTLLRHCFPGASYYLLEDPDLISIIKSDPRGFLEEVKCPVIFDEIQNIPEILNYIRSRIDADPSLKGQWLLAGSQEAPLMKNVSESMAGRTAVFQLLPFSVQENKKTGLFLGGFPEVLEAPSIRQTWFRSYIQTYLERDVRLISGIKDLSVFRRFMSLLASRTGAMLNRSEFAASLGVSVPTITSWLSILEITGQILLVSPFYENFGKRLIKSPKLYILDSGLACYLLGLDSEEAMLKSPFLGALFEGFVAGELTKFQINSNQSREVYYFRDRTGLEVDFIVPKAGRVLSLIEVKSSRTPSPKDAAPLKKLAEDVSDYQKESTVIYRFEGESYSVSSLGSNVRIGRVKDIPDILTS